MPMALLRKTNAQDALDFIDSPLASVKCLGTLGRFRCLRVLWFKVWTP